MSTYDTSVTSWRERVRPSGDVALLKEASDIKELVSLEESEYEELSALTRFDLAHPQFKWFFLINVLLSAALVYIGLQFADSHPPIVLKVLMQSNGVQTMSADALTQSIKASGDSVYWLKPMPGDLYTDKTNQKGVHQISYIPGHIASAKSPSFDLIIKTFANAALYNLQLRPLAGPNEKTVIIPNGVTIEYNPDLTDHVIVSFQGKEEIVIINYPTTQEVNRLLSDAESLVTI